MEERRLEIQKYLEKATDALETAIGLLENHRYPHAVSKAYYAMFYAACAVLRTKELDTSKHSGVQALFGFHFVKEGLIDPRYHSMLVKALEDRGIADYSIFTEVTESVSERRVRDATAFVEAMRHYLQAQGWL